MNMQRQLAWLALAGSLMTMGFAYVAAAGFRFLSTPVGLMLTLWTLLPYLLIFCVSRVAVSPGMQRWVIAVCWLLVVLALLAYTQALFIALDAQSALIFLFAPVLQSMVAMLLLITVYVFRQ